MMTKDAALLDPAAEDRFTRLERVNIALVKTFTTREQHQLFGAFMEAEALARDEIEDGHLDRYSEALAGHFPAFAPAILAVWRQVLDTDQIRATERE